MARKRSLGRRKIPMKMISSRSARHVTFSKRRLGLFKKASELAILTGADVAIIVFSPAGKPFSFGHPSVDIIANRVCNWGSPLNDCPSPPRADVSALNQQFNDLVLQVDAEKRRGEKLQKELEKSSYAFLKRPVDQLNLSQLVEGKTAMEELSEKLAKHVQGLSLKGFEKPSSYANSPRLFDLNAYPLEIETSGSP